MVAGSNPAGSARLFSPVAACVQPGKASRSSSQGEYLESADVAQLVELLPSKQNVASSSLVVRSNLYRGASNEGLSEKGFE
jgi:hypothetical protein